MVKNNIWLGMLAMVLVFGMMVVGCDDGSANDNGKEENNNGKEEVDNTITWTYATNNPFGSSSISSIVYGAGKFVAGGHDGKMAYSIDGISWAAINSPFSANNYSIAITYGDGKFVAIGSTLTGSDMVTTSTDGIVWTTAVGSSALNNTFTYDIAYGGGKFVTGRRNMAYSTDGQTWMTATNNAFDSFPYAQFHCIVYGNGKFVAGGNSGSAKGILGYSTDGEIWLPITDNTNNTINNKGVISGIAYGNGKFVAYVDGSFGGGMMYSEDGITWTDANVSNIYGYTFGKNIGFGGNKFVAYDNGKTLYSTDGITWNYISSTGGGSVIAYGGTHNSERFVAGIYLALMYSNIQN